jgi:hypothetical protein
MEKFIEISTKAIDETKQKTKFGLITYAITKIYKNKNYFMSYTDDVVKFINYVINILLSYNAFHEIVKVIGMSYPYTCLKYLYERESVLSDYKRIAIFYTINGNFNDTNNSIFLQNRQIRLYLDLINSFNDWEENFVCISKDTIIIYSSDERKEYVLCEADWLSFIKIFITSCIYENFIRQFIKETKLINSVDFLNYVLETDNDSVLSFILTGKHLIIGDTKINSTEVSISNEKVLESSDNIFLTICDKCIDRSLSRRHYELFLVYPNSEYYFLNDYTELKTYFSSEIRDISDIDSLIILAEENILPCNCLHFLGNSKIFSDDEIINYLNDNIKVKDLILIVIEYMKSDPYESIRTFLNHQINHQINHKINL